jgi:hypothetical protein
MKFFVFAFIAFFLLTCKKSLVNEKELRELNFEELFFKPPLHPTKEITELISLLKKENDKTGFVNKLPLECGLPIWEKFLGLKEDNHTVLPTNNNGSYLLYIAANTVIVPFSENNTNLSGLLFITANPDGSYKISFTSQNELRQNVYDARVSTITVEKKLILFIYFENAIWGRTEFLNIPHNIFDKTGVTHEKGERTIKLVAVQSPQITSHYYCIQLTFICTVCWQVSCPLSQIIQACGYTEETGGGGGGEGSGSGEGGGGGGGSGGNCNVPFYIFRVNPCSIVPPPDTTSVITKLKNYSLAINRTADSVFQLSMIVPQKEYAFILVKNNQNTIYPKNIKNDNDPDAVTVNWFLQNNETLLAQWHSHQDASTNLNDRPGPSHDDIIALNAHGHQTKLHFVSFVDCGNVRFAIVIEDPIKANTFFRNVNFGNFDVYETYMNSLNNNPLRGINYQQAGLEATIAVIGSASSNGIAVYKSTDILKTEYEKKN